MKQHGAVQRQVLEMQERAEREAHQARCDRAQLRQQLSRDVKAVDDVMAGVTYRNSLCTYNSRLNM